MSLLASLFGGPDINDAVAEARATDGAVLIDVRTPGEFAEGHIEGAVNIPLDRIGHARVAPTAAAPLFVYCASGARSDRACRELARLHRRPQHRGHRALARTGRHRGALSPCITLIIIRNRKEPS